MKEVEALEPRWQAPGDEAVLCKRHAEAEWKRFAKDGWVEIPDHHLGIWVEATGSQLPCDFCYGVPPQKGGLT